MIVDNNCCQPQELWMDNTTGYLSITDGNSVYLGTIIQSLGIKTPVIDFRLNGFFLIITYTAADGSIQNKSVDLTAFSSGGTLSPTDTSTIDLTIGGGTISGIVKISAIAGNTIIAQSDGIYAPTFTETNLTVNSTSTIGLTAGGTHGHLLTATLLISADAGNQVSVHADGLYIADQTTYVLPGSNITLAGSGTASSPYIVSASGFTNIPLQVSDSTSLHLATSGISGHNLTGNVIISSALNNALVALNDGLYVPVPTVNTFTTAQARLAISSTAPITYDNVTGVIGAVAATSLVNGYLTNVDWNTFNNKIASGATLGSLSSVPIYSGQSGQTLNFNALRAGSNISISLAGNDIIIAGNAGGLNGAATFNVDFIVGDGGLMTPTNGASTFAPGSNPLQGKTILGFFIEGVKIAGVPRSGGQVSWSFVPSTGVITLVNATFVTDAYYSILYK